LRNDVEYGCGWLLYLNPQISTENIPKNAKRDNLLKNKRILKLEYKKSGDLVFAFSLPGGQF